MFFTNIIVEKNSYSEAKLHVTTEKIHLEYVEKTKNHEKVDKSEIEVMEKILVTENTAAPEKFTATMEPTTTKSEEKLSTNEILAIEKVSVSQPPAQIEQPIENAKPSDLQKPEIQNVKNAKNLKSNPNPSHGHMIKPGKDYQHLATPDVPKKAILVPEVPSIISERAEFMPNGAPPPNPNFIFHNKVPKSGSSTMKHIFKESSLC